MDIIPILQNSPSTKKWSNLPKVTSWIREWHAPRSLWGSVRGREVLALDKEKSPGIIHMQMNLSLFKVLALGTSLRLLGATSQTVFRNLVWELSQEPEAHIVKNIHPTKGVWKFFSRARKIVWANSVYTMTGGTGLKISPDCVIMKGTSYAAYI